MFAIHKHIGNKGNFEQISSSKVFALKMNVVCGGGDHNGPLSTCEYNNPGENNWLLLNSLPYGMALNGLRLISVGYNGFYLHDLMIGMMSFQNLQFSSPLYAVQEVGKIMGGQIFMTPYMPWI